MVAENLKKNKDADVRARAQSSSYGDVCESSGSEEDAPPLGEKRKRTEEPASPMPSPKRPKESPRKPAAKAPPKVQRKLLVEPAKPKATETLELLKQVNEASSELSDEE